MAAGAGRVIEASGCFAGEPAGVLPDVRLTLKDGLTWIDASGREKRETAIKDWIGERGQAGRIAPKGFNKSGRFTP